MKPTLEGAMYENYSNFLVFIQFEQNIW